MKSKLKIWEEATQNITNAFLKKYFPANPKWHWISDKIGGVLSVNDFYFDLDRIIDAMRMKPTPFIFFKYYELEKSTPKKKLQFTFKSFCELN